MPNLLDKWYIYSGNFLFFSYIYIYIYIYISQYFLIYLSIYFCLFVPIYQHICLLLSFRISLSRVHMDVPMLADQQELIYNGSARSDGWWTNGKRESGKSVLAAWLDDLSICLFASIDLSLFISIYLSISIIPYIYLPNPSTKDTIWLMINFKAE